MVINNLLVVYGTINFISSDIKLLFQLNNTFFYFIINIIRQVIIVLTQLEGSGGFSIAHKLTHRLANQAGLHDWGPPGCSHLPQIQKSIEGLHSPRLIT